MTERSQTALGDLLDKGVMFDISSCQFSLHYSFESEKKAHGLMSNAASRLVQGGYFIGTTVDALEIVYAHFRPRRVLKVTPSPGSVCERSQGGRGLATPCSRWSSRNR